MQAYNFERQGKTFVIFKPMFDTRDGCFVKSRALDEMRDAIGIHASEEGIMYSTAAFEKPDFIFVDELQFMPAHQVEELAHISMDLKIPVFAYGLLISYTGELFEGSKRAIECGFTLNELKMQCDMCTEKSTHHLLHVDGKVMKNGNPMQVGDTEYSSVCFTCYTEAMN